MTHAMPVTSKQRQKDEKERKKEGRKEIFYLAKHSTYFIYGYMVKDHSDSAEGKPLPPIHGYSF